MRFITEFELDGTYWDQSPIIIGCRKNNGEERIGNQIGEAFGWYEKGETTLEPNSPVIHKYKLEIEAFPIDKWLEFKQNMSTAIRYGHGVSGIEDLLKELESHGTKKEPL